MPTEEELNARQRYEQSRTAKPRTPVEEEQKTGLAGFHQRGMEGAKDTATSAGRGISKALMGSAFESFGKAFEGGGYTPRGQKPGPSDAAMSPWRQQGINTQQLMENRWHMAEFKQFKKSYLDPFQANLQELQDGAETLGKELDQGRWPTIDGGVDTFDMKNEADRMKMLRLRGQLEKDLTMKATEMHIALNNEASQKYANNPIVDSMIGRLMDSVTKQNTSQFKPTQAMAAGAQEAGIKDVEANTEYKRALTDKARAETAGAAGTKYMSTDQVMSNLGPEQAVRYFTNHVRGKELLEANSAFPGYLQQMETRLRKQYRANNKLTDAEALDKINEAKENDFIKENGPRMFRRAIGEFVKGEYGDEAYQAAGASREGLFPDPAGPKTFDVKTNPTKKETKKKEKEWNTLGKKMADEELRKDPKLSREEAVDWLMDEWFPEALQGHDIVTDSYLEQFEGLTADEANKAAAPYIKAIRDSLRKYAEKWVGTGAENEGLLPEQRPPRKHPRMRGGAFSKTLARGIDLVTPDALFPEVGEGLYPEDFEEQHPKKKTTE